MLSKVSLSNSIYLVLYLIYYCILLCLQRLNKGYFVIPLSKLKVSAFVITGLSHGLPSSLSILWKKKNDMADDLGLRPIYDNGKLIIWPKSLQTFFGGLFAKRFRVTSLWGKHDQNVLFLALFWVMRPSKQIKLSIFHQALINIAHQTRLTFDLETETTHGHSSSFRTRTHDCR